MLKGADIVLQCLRAEGVDLVFGYAGGAIMPLYDALEGSGGRHILTRHAQGAVFAAEGYARVTGKVVLGLATSSPGPTNLVPGIPDARLHSVPITDLRRVLAKLNSPTFATVHGLGAVEPQSPYYLGMVGMHGTRAANMALHETDLLLVLGARLDDRVTGEPTRFAPHAKIVHFEIDQIGRASGRERV